MSVFKKYITQNEEPTTGAPTPSTSSAPSSTPASSSAPATADSKQSSSQKPSTNTSQIAAGSGRNMLSSDVEIKGKVRFTNDLVVDGKIEGEIDSDGSLTVGENARVRAEIRTRSVVIYGKVHGNIVVTDHVEIKANAELVGDIKAATISIEAGAIFVGKSVVGAPSTVPAAATPKADAKAATSGTPAKKEKAAPAAS